MPDSHAGTDATTICERRTDGYRRVDVSANIGLTFCGTARSAAGRDDMLVLVDYDNIEKVQRRAGPRSVVQRIAQALAATLPRQSPTRLDMRLYGGWYGISGPTKYAQGLAIDLQRDFPMSYTPHGIQNAAPLRVNAELAYSQLVDPGHHLLHTYRDRRCPDGLRAVAPSKCGCTKVDCGLRHLPALLSSAACPEQGCNVTLEQLVFRGEQKLVDAMLASDLMFEAARAPRDPIAIVTSDQDLWPAIKHALALGISVRHVHTKPGGTPRHYKAAASPATYSEVVM